MKFETFIILEELVGIVLKDKVHAPFYSLSSIAIIFANAHILFGSLSSHALQ